MKRRGAFTLIEIIVVFTVMMVLAAILLGVSGRVRESGRRATCQNNLHQIYLALSQYVADNDAHFPTFPQGKEKMMPYLKSSQVYICPSVPRPFPAQFTSQDIGQDYDFALGWLTSLSFIPSQGSGLLLPRLVGVNEAALVDVAKIPVLSDVPYLAYADNNVEAPFPQGGACGLTWADGTPETSSTWPTLHNGGLNVLLYDGHIKWMTPDQASSMMCEAGVYAQPPFRAGGSHISRGSR